MEKPHAIVVGAGPGVGRGVAEAFAKGGFAVSLLSRNIEKLRDDVTHLNQQGASVQSIAANAVDHISLDKAIKKAIEAFGVAEVLVFNVLAFSQGKPSTIEPGSLVSDFNTNVAASLACVHSVLPAMLERKKGTILFTGGGWALDPSVDFASLSIDKAALRTLAFMLAEELKGSGVRVGTVTIMGTVAPGTPFDPRLIGKSFLDVYRQPDHSFPVEFQFKGA